MKIKIHVTKEIYRKAMMCGTQKRYDSSVPTSCAIALAVRKVAPKAYITNTGISWLGIDQVTGLYIGRFSGMPDFVNGIVSAFDALRDKPEERLLLPEFSFEVDFPDELIENIGLDEVKAIMEKSETLEFVAPLTPS